MAARSVFHCLECTKCVGGWGLAPDPTGGAYSTPPDPLAGGEGACRPLPRTPPPLSALRASILAPRPRRLEPNPPLIFHNSHTASDDEILGDLVVGNESMVFTTPQSRFTVPCDTEPCLIDSALLNDDEVRGMAYFFYWRIIVT